MASGHQNRKYWSYFGALKRGEAEAPRAEEIVQWSPANPKHLDIKDYFDPGNWLYTVAMKVLFRQVLVENGWNEETVGDIVESLLGIQFLKRNYDVPQINIPDQFIDFLHLWCLSIYRLMMATAWEHKNDLELTRVIVSLAVD